MIPVPEWDQAATWRTFEDGTFRHWTQGIEIQKSAADLDRYLHAVEASGAQAIIETGTRTGGSALWFHYELGLDVMTIDVAPQFVPAIGPPHTGEGITWVTGSSTDLRVVGRAVAFAAGRKTMVSLDSDHHAPHVRAEIGLYGPLVSSGCHLVVEDGCFDLFPRHEARRGGHAIPEIGGPYRAVCELGMDTDPTWERAIEIEAMNPISHSPCGWWKKR